MTNRIANLPRRDWTEKAELIRDDMTSALRTPYGTMRLRPVQAAALYEAFETGGLFANIRVGGGKTIITALLPQIMGAERPLLLVPASLIRKTRDEFRELRKHWQIINTLRVESYTKLGVTRHAELLWDYRPDLIIADEAHKLKHVRKSACARRVARYISEFPETKMAALSGTLTKGSIKDYAHILDWCLRDFAPIPRTIEGQDKWASCLDPKVEKRGNPGDLRESLGDRVLQGVKEARQAYRDRLIQTPGVIVSIDSFEGAGLTIQPKVVETPEKMEEHFANLRTLWMAPDEWLLADSRFEVWAVARQLALGFYYKHEPRPPRPWFNARKNWCSFVRHVLSYSEHYDSQLQVFQACEAGTLNPLYWVDERQEHVDVFAEWLEIKDTFIPNTVPVWLSDHAVKAAQEWGTNQGGRGGIVWVEHQAFARKLAERTGWPYFGAKGRDDQTGRYIEQTKPGETIIASVAANMTGRNLQKHSRNLIVSPLNSGVGWEQKLGRTHREGQLKDVVTVDYFVACYENLTCLENAIAECSYAFHTTGQPQKLLLADLIKPPRELYLADGYAWQQTQPNTE